MKRLEKKVIDYMREAIATYHTDRMLVCKNFDLSHRLFAEHVMQWSEDFAKLQQQMYALWCAYTPKPTGQYRVTSIEIGYTAHQITKWANDKVQPPVPTTDELLNRFDQLLNAYAIQRERRECPMAQRAPRYAVHYEDTGLFQQALRKAHDNVDLVDPDDFCCKRALERQGHCVHGIYERMNIREASLEGYSEEYRMLHRGEVDWEWDDEQEICE